MIPNPETCEFKFAQTARTARPHVQGFSSDDHNRSFVSISTLSHTLAKGAINQPYVVFNMKR